MNESSDWFKSVETTRKIVVAPTGFFCKETNEQTSKPLSKQEIASWGGRIRTQFGWHCQRTPVPAPRTIMSVWTIARTS